jgi:hypothetical protein
MEANHALVELLTFDRIPTSLEILERARRIAHLARVVLGDPTDDDQAMIGGAPFLLGPLEYCLREQGIFPLYAFSVRESEEVPGEGGTVKKVSFFKHRGFVLALDDWECK